MNTITENEIIEHLNIDLSNIENPNFNTNYNPINKGHKIYSTYTNLINNNDMYFKYGLLWYCLKMPSIDNNNTNISISDLYEFEYKFLRRMNLEQIKQILEYRLYKAISNKRTNKLLIHDIIKYKQKLLTIRVNDTATTIYNIFLYSCKNYSRYMNNSKTSIVSNELIKGANRVIKCFKIAGLIKEDIDENIIKNYIKNMFGKDFNIGY